MIKLYSKFLDLLEWVEKVILAVSVFVMVIIMVYQVILRYVFSNPNAWSEELARYLFILNVMLAAAIAVRRNSHMQIDILINLFSERVKHIFTIISTIAGIVAASIALLLMNFSKNDRTVGESRAWLKRIIVSWALLNGLGFIMSYITPFFADGKWTP